MSPLTSGAQQSVRLRTSLRALQDQARGTFELTRPSRAMRLHPTDQEAPASWQ